MGFLKDNKKDEELKGNTDIEPPIEKVIKKRKQTFWSDEKWQD